MTKDPTRPLLAITMGDPAGIGPEIAAKALAQADVYEICRPLVIGSAAAMEQAVKWAGPVTVHPVERVEEARFRHGTIDVLDLPVDAIDIKPGEISAKAGELAFQAVKTAIELALEKRLDATVTGPIHKEAINLAGHHYSGHTEIYADLTGSKDVAMLLVHENLRVIHVTTHVPLRQACDLIREERVFKVISLLDEACRQFGIDSPRIGVAGLNPHASDGGLFGHEEKDEIAPAIERARRKGILVDGPVPPDSLFPKAVGGFYDGCVAMYHDQGHIPFKLVGFKWNEKLRRMESVSGVNITLGLPIIRTSVDHGTAFEIAGQGVASPAAMRHAIEYAVKMAKFKKEHTKAHTTDQIQHGEGNL